ncbi:ABC transporter ATP-binding protein [Dissulfurirhabdus thermomarina]|uniref:ABC transporter ATP-binding protein n=1 Tax=Dissulfurirhabdus thermomarina TaxID=1765737 RepID=A0A6N9TTS3_DISTH|nr:ABC transporter ATP-binding protein [Dissulfurirhabdus thermomarina]NDY43503.1 ABC transporter ATP-binding protein [Dissulfurirhabdus thermomarina]NMX22734.1 ABC transporter ATP-binding protein [Dissulfurirhabdus thermomarina]
MSRALLEVTGVRKAYGAAGREVVAVAGVSAAFRPGTVTAIMGPSGSGKTTLLSILGLILRPDAGRVEVGGTDVTGYDEGRLPALRRRYFGFVFQAFNLFAALTALENVMVSLQLKGVPRGEAPERARRALERVGLADRAGFLPRDLSGGEKQRVSVARAVAADAPIILADEPTGNLDSRSGRAVVDLLAELAVEGGKTVVVVTHDLRLRDRVDRVLWMEDGRMREAA